MKKILLTVFAIASLTAAFRQASAFVRYEDKHPKKVTEVHMTGYIDYAPFGYVDNPNTLVYGKFHTLFQPMIDYIIKEANLKMHYDLQQRTVDDLIQKVRAGDIDFMVGAYYETEKFKGLYLLYPAAVYNPITVFMLPNRINEVKSTEDLKKLKGVRNVDEAFSDYVEKQLEPLNLIEAENSYDMFEKLFTKKADYIVTSYYYGMIEATKLGIQKQVAPAKQTLWNIPMFVGVSKTSRHRDLIAKRLTSWLHNAENLKVLQASLQQMIKEIEQKYAGTVPPTFGLEKIEEPAAAPAVEEQPKNEAENLDNGVDAK